MAVMILDSRPVQPASLTATVLFVDLRGYTGLAEQLPAQQLVPLLSELFAMLTESVETAGGQVFYLMGDGMMAGFGTRSPADPCAAAALAAARSMLDHFEPMVARWRAALSIETGIGIGLHVGEVALANLGPRGRETPTLLGDTVNVSARLCSRARAGEILFSQAVAMAIQEGSPQALPMDGLQSCLRLPRFEVRGRAAPLDIWCLPSTERLTLEQNFSERTDLEAPLSLP